MRIIKVILLIIIFFLGLLFLVQNQESLQTSFKLTFDIFSIYSWQSSQPIPFYYVLICAFTLGMILVAAFFAFKYPVLVVKSYAYERSARALQKEKESMQQQIANLKKQLEEATKPSQPSPGA